MARVYPVTINNGVKQTRYSAEFQTEKEFSVQWKKVLQDAHGKFDVRCCCLGRGDKELAVRYYEDSDSYGLARFPLTGEEHGNECRFYAPNPAKSGMSGYEKGVIDERPDGTTKIRLSVGLTKRDPATVQAAPNLDQPAATGKTRTQPAMRLLGLLHLLWNEAGLNVWWPAMEKKRNLGRIHWWLNSAAEHIIAGKVKLNSVLLAGASSETGADAKRNISRVRDAIENQTRLVVIVPLATCSADREKSISSKLPIAGYHGIPLLEMTEAKWKAAERQFPLAVAAWRQGQRVMAIAQVDPRKEKRGPVAEVINLALMQVTQNWIPVDSSYEQIIADKLTAEQRGYVKPLRFDAGEDTVFPDFILLDTGKDTPMEVFGRTDEAYEARKAEKIEYYKENFGSDGWWCWNAAADTAGAKIPPFPPLARRAPNN